MALSEVRRGYFAGRNELWECSGLGEEIACTLPVPSGLAPAAHLSLLDSGAGKTLATCSPVCTSWVNHQGGAEMLGWWLTCLLSGGRNVPSSV